MTATLQLRFSPHSKREASAWFVPGTDASAWLTELVAWGVPSSALTLRIVPRSRTDRTPIGVLASVANSASPQVSYRCHAYGQIAGQLLVPIEAELSPQVTDEELRDLWPIETEFVWHPQAGLVAFGPEDRLTLADLLQPPPETQADWSAADPGVSCSSRLRAIEVLQPLSLGSIMQDARGDIGTQSKSLDQLPPSDNESSAGALRKTSNFLMRPFAAFAQWVTNQVPATASQETMWNRLERWAAQVLSPEWQSERDKELSRLMQMLEDDPDQGLKYALPMGGDAPRGVAPPSKQLSRRNVDFRLSSGGGPADAWNVSFEMQQKLTARYRELADREIRQGRHRRAAYIYAELLGDWSLAAAALRSGNHFREAAVLYEERLKRPADAAACYEEGGHWNEAIAIYEHLENFEAVGRIHRRLEQHEEADAAYLQAAKVHERNLNFLSAAKIYETELSAIDAAYETLRNGWPSSSQAQGCLKEGLQLLGRNGRHADATAWIDELNQRVYSTEPTAWLASTLADSSQNYPNESVRSHAANATRSVVSRVLTRSQSLRILPDHRLLQAVEKLVPSDRLLSRDCNRYLQIQESRQRTKSNLSVKPSSCVVQTRREGFLFGVDWIDAQATNRGFYALGRYEGRIGLAYAYWGSLGSPPQWQIWTDLPKYDGRPMLLAVARSEKPNVWLHAIGGLTMRTRDFDRAVVKTPPWAKPTTIAIAQTAQGGSVMLMEEDFGYSVNAFSPDQTPIVSHSIPVVERPTTSFLDDSPPAGIPCHARSMGAFFGLDDYLLQTSPTGGIIWHRFEETVTSLSGSTPNSRLRVAVGLGTGGVVMWPDIKHKEAFGETLRSPQTTFTLSGHLVAADESRIEVYTSNRCRLERIASIDSPARPVAVMPVGTNEFAILDRRSDLSLYRIDR